MQLTYYAIMSMMMAAFLSFVSGFSWCDGRLRNKLGC